MFVPTAIATGKTWGTVGDWADAISKFAAAIAALCGGIWAIFLYGNAKKAEYEAALIANQQGFLTKRLDLYFEATSHAATITTSMDEAERTTNPVTDGTNPVTDGT
jgi:hypothetical protein